MKYVLYRRSLKKKVVLKFNAAGRCDAFQEMPGNIEMTFLTGPHRRFPHIFFAATATLQRREDVICNPEGH